jgi:hypothetical protein
MVFIAMAFRYLGLYQFLSQYPHKKTLLANTFLHYTTPTNPSPFHLGHWKLILARLDTGNTFPILMVRERSFRPRNTRKWGMGTGNGECCLFVLVLKLDANNCELDGDSN